MSNRKSYIKQIVEKNNSTSVWPYLKIGIKWFFNFGIPLIALYIAFISFGVSERSLQLTDSSLALTKQSIDSSNKVTTQTLDYLRSISNSSDGMKNNFDYINKKMEVLPNQVDNISNSMASMDSITSEQFKRQKDETLRKPNIEIYLICNSNTSGTTFLLYNSGDAEAEITLISLKSDNSGDIEFPDRDIIISPRAYKRFHSYKYFTNGDNVPESGLDIEFIIDYISKYHVGSVNGTHINCFKK